MSIIRLNLLKMKYGNTNSDDVRTPGYCVSPSAAPSTLSPSPSCVQYSRIASTQRESASHFLSDCFPLHEWEEERTYGVNPLACIQYRIDGH
jgi:hypothetical protein